MPKLIKNDESLGELLRVTRKSAGMGIKTASAAVNVTHGYLSKVENDKKFPSRGLIIRLCDIYKCNKDAKSKLLELSDELLARSGNLPTDIRQIVQTHGDDVFKLIRSTFTNSEDEDGISNDNKP